VSSLTKDYFCAVMISDTKKAWVFIVSITIKPNESGALEA
jgi:hypothetical protein